MSAGIMHRRRPSGDIDPVLCNGSQTESCVKAGASGLWNTLEAEGCPDIPDEYGIVGTPDLRWDVRISAPAGQVTDWAPAVDALEGGNPGWFGTNWVSLVTDNNSTGHLPPGGGRGYAPDNVDVQFRTYFEATDLALLAGAGLDGVFWADDWLLDLSLNGTAGTADFGNSFNRRFSNPGGYTFSLPTAAAVLGQNEVIFTVRNESGFSGTLGSPVGLAVQWTC